MLLKKTFEPAVEPFRAARRVAHYWARMFYSTNVLQKKGPLGAIWIAAHHDVAKKLTKLQILNTDIVKTAGVDGFTLLRIASVLPALLSIETYLCAGQIENPETEMSLRLSSHLLAGLSRIYTRKVQFLFTDCNEALTKITLVRQTLTNYSDCVSYLIQFPGVSTKQCRSWTSQQGPNKIDHNR